MISSKILYQLCLLLCHQWGWSSCRSFLPLHQQTLHWWTADEGFLWSCCWWFSPPEEFSSVHDNDHSVFLWPITNRISRSTHIVNNQFLFVVLPSELPYAHLDKILEGGVHVDILVLQLAAAGPKLHLLNKSADPGWGWRRRRGEGFGSIQDVGDGNEK